jgi:hypothetical protein
MFCVVNTERRSVVLALCAAVALLSSCDQQGQVAITATREFVPANPIGLPKVSSRERLIQGDPMAAAHGAQDHADADADAGAGIRSVLDYDVPQGWVELPPTSNAFVKRMINLRPADDPATECYLTFLTGDGGGIKANIDRWRGQIGLGPIAPAELEKLPKVEMFGTPSPFYLGEGDLVGMDGTKRADFALAAVILAREGSAMSIKMTGPKAVVLKELDRFKAFVRSLRPAREAAREAAQDAAATRPSASQPAASKPGASQPAKQDLPTSADGVTWTVPGGWRQLAQQRQFRLVTFALDQAPGTECYVSKSGGALDANLNRWRGQFALQPLTPAEIAALPTLPVLGKPSKLIEIRGAFSGGMGAKPIADAMMLGVVCEQQPQSVFVRLTGPRSEVEAARAKFEELCKSLR